MIQSALSEIQTHLPAVAASVIAGGSIGLEREWRGRAAGFRTHILVCLASTLLMQAAMSQGSWAFEALPNENIVTDPTRMAHGVLTGIGFLCAGVIFRTGLSIHGLTTAASLWITSALGILFGAGLNGLGALGTIVTVAILLGLRLINRWMPDAIVVDAEARWPRGANAIAAKVEAALADAPVSVASDRFALIDGGETVSRTWRLTARGRADLSALATALDRIEGLTGYDLDRRTE